MNADTRRSTVREGQRGAQILAFKPREARTRPQPAAEADWSSWYHDAAIKEAQELASPKQ